MKQRHDMLCICTVLFVEIDLVYFLSCFSASILWFIDALLFVCVCVCVCKYAETQHASVCVCVFASEWIQHNFTDTRSLSATLCVIQYSSTTTSPIQIHAKYNGKNLLHTNTNAFALPVNWANSIQLECKRILMKISHTRTLEPLLAFVCFVWVFWRMLLLARVWLCLCMCLQTHCCLAVRLLAG